MKKKTLTTVALGAATLAVGMAGNVHADSVKVTKQQIGDETKITTTTTKDVNQQKIAQDKQNISSQQTVVSSAKSSLDKAKTNASSASQVVSSAQSKVNDAKKALDAAKASQPDQIKHQVATDQSQVNTDKQNISSTQSSITTDKSNVAKDQQAINNVGQKAQQDQNKLNNDQSKLSSAQSTLNNDQKQLDHVNSQIADSQVPPAFNFNDPNYANAYWKAFFDESNLELGNYNEKHEDESDKEIKYVLYGEGGSGVGAWNAFKPTKADDYQVDPSNLTNDQKMDLSVFAAQVINEYKDMVAKWIDNNVNYLHSIGINDQDIKEYKTHVNASNVCVDVAQDFANYLVNKLEYRGNDVINLEIMDESAANNYFFDTLSPKYNDGGRYGFTHCGDAGNIGAYGKDGKYTMNDVKELTYDAIIGMIYQDMQDFKHGNALLGSNYIGIALTENPDSAKDLVVIVPGSDDVERHEVTNDDAYMQTRPSTINNSQVDVSQLQNQVNKDKQVVNDLQNQVNADKAQLQKDTPAGLQQQLQNDQKKLANDQATLQKQQQKLAQDEAQLKADQNKLNSITPEDIANAQKALEQAQTNYNNAVKALNDAQSKANASNDELAKAQQNYINALNKLNELKQILENDEKQITTTSVQWIKNQHPTTTSSMGNKVVLHSSSEANTVHADTVSAVKDAIHFTSETPVSSKKAAKKNTLPQMGDENSNKTVWGEISLAMAGVLATLGLAGKKRHE